MNCLLHHALHMLITSRLVYWPLVLLTEKNSGYALGSLSWAWKIRLISRRLHLVSLDWQLYCPIAVYSYISKFWRYLMYFIIHLPQSYGYSYRWERSLKRKELDCFRNPISSLNKNRVFCQGFSSTLFLVCKTDAAFLQGDNQIPSSAANHFPN